MVKKEYSNYIITSEALNITRHVFEYQCALKSL